MPIVFDDGRLGAACHLRVSPTHIVIGRDGRIQYAGHLADKDLDTALVAARAPAAYRPHPLAVANQDSPPIGIGDKLPKIWLRTLGGQRFELQSGAAQQKATALV